jgi:hypothetical protein
MVRSLGHAKPLSQVIAKPEMFSMGLLMATKQKQAHPDLQHRARRQLFLDWYALAFTIKGKNRQDFIAAAKRPGEAKLTKGRVSQLFNIAQPFGEDAARNLAQRLNLDENAFLPVPPAKAPTQLERILLDSFSKFDTDDDRLEAINCINELLTKKLNRPGTHDPFHSAGAPGEAFQYQKKHQQPAHPTEKKPRKA